MGNAWKNGPGGIQCLCFLPMLKENVIIIVIDDEDDKMVTTRQNASKGVCVSVLVLKCLQKAVSSLRSKYFEDSCLFR